VSEIESIDGEMEILCVQKRNRHVLCENIATAKLGLMRGIFDGGRASTVLAGQASRAAT
jgi:hypothetical protein